VTDFTHENLSGARFEDVHLTGADFHGVDLTGARFRLVDMTGVTIRGADLVDVEISGQIENLRINGVDVAPLVEAELDRRHPGRAKMRPSDAWASRPPGIRWTGHTTRCPTSPASPATAMPARPSTKCCPCAPTGWPPCAKYSPATRPRRPRTPARLTGLYPVRTGMRGPHQRWGHGPEHRTPSHLELGGTAVLDLPSARLGHPAGDYAAVHSARGRQGAGKSPCRRRLKTCLQ
jgi:hypothetical protein